MNKTQKGFAVIETLLILVVVAIIGGTGYYVWHTKNQTDKSLDASAGTNQAATKTKTSSSKAPLDFDSCVKSNNQAGAILDDSGTTLTCYPPTFNPSKDKITHPALATVKTISATLSLPTFAQLPQAIRQVIVNSFPQDCSGKKVTADSPTDSAVSARQAGNFIMVVVGCDAAEQSTFELSDGNWKPVNNVGKVDNKRNKEDCSWIVSQKYPIELLKMNNVPIAKCQDGRFIEHQVVTE